jgi:sialate O-acetylesterase
MSERSVFKSGLSVLAVTFILVSAALDVHAEVIPHSLFADHCVLQRGVSLPVWGRASNQEKVTVQFAGQSVSTVAKEGKWMVWLKPLKASATPSTLTIQGSNTVLIRQVLVGEVWLCSGQSNMAFPLRAIKPRDGYKELQPTLQEANAYPMIRQYSMPLIKHEQSPLPVSDVKGRWQVCDSLHARDFSAVAYFFARELYRNLQVPIGILNVSYGGTAIENWMSREALTQNPEWNILFTNFDKSMKEFPGKLADYQNNLPYIMQAYSRDSLLAVQSGKELPRKPAPPMSPVERGGPTGLWNTMISPLIPFAIKGCVWYQGEANASRGRQYRGLLTAMMNQWRKDFQQGAFPFIIIQIPGWKNHAPELREAQLMATQQLEKAALVVITDCDDTLDVHPGNKEPVGIRASKPALALAYGKTNKAYSGPIYKQMEIVEGKIVLQFDQVGSRLVSKNGELLDFEIAGSDQQFFPAKAQIAAKDKVWVSSPKVPRPVSVRMGWRLCPLVNLYNSEGLCAAAFRTNPD